MLIDAHCHLDHLGMTGASIFLSKLAEKNLEGLVVAGTRSRDWKFYAPLAEQFPSLHVCYGIHPLEISEHWEQDLEQLRMFLPKAVAVGEIGLDFHGMFDRAHISEMKRQMKVFERQLRIAQFYQLPVVIHCRDAFFAIQEILLYTKFDLHRVMFHCFVEDVEAARWILSNGGIVSYSGVLTFKKFGDTHDTAALADLSQVVVETDSPYLTPAPFRGEQNSPDYVRYVAEKLAEIKNISYEDCVAATAQNTRRFFGF